MNTVHHEAVMQQQWVVDEKAYDEQQLIGYICTCGERKAADKDELLSETEA